MSRNFEIVDVEQKSDEWFAVRAGRVTGSNASAVMAGKETATRRNYLARLAAERMLGHPWPDEFSNRHMQNGMDTEPLARIAVEQRYGKIVRETGFLRHTKLMIGVSLDGDFGDFAHTLEIKCPIPATHMDYLLADKLPTIYRWQIVHGLYITGAKGCMFASYVPDMPEHLELFTIEVAAKDLPITEYEMALLAFLKEVETRHEQLLDLQERMKNVWSK